jgi:hypothetical protein
VKVTASSRSEARTASTVTKGSGVLSEEGRESNFNRAKPRPINKTRIPSVQRMFRGMLERKLEDIGYQSAAVRKRDEGGRSMLAGGRLNTCPSESNRRASEA